MLKKLSLSLIMLIAIFSSSINSFAATTEGKEAETQSSYSASISAPSSAVVGERISATLSWTVPNPSSATIDWGDGTDFTNVAPSGSSYTEDYEYSQFGTYTISGVVYDENGIGYHDSTTIEIYP